MSQDKVSSSAEQSRPIVLPGEARERLDLAIDLLRREWRGGFEAGMQYRTALGSVRRLRGLAPTDQAAESLKNVIADLEAYGDLPRERRDAMGRRGREHVLAMFGLDRMAEEYEALFERALSERKERAAG